MYLEAITLTEVETGKQIPHVLSQTQILVSNCYAMCIYVGVSVDIGHEMRRDHEREKESLREEGLGVIEPLRHGSGRGTTGWWVEGY